MSAKLKLLLGVFAFGVLGAVPYIRSLTPTDTSSDIAATAARQVLLTDAQVDTDGDGLTDRDEQYWRTDADTPDTDGDSFLDGEEVASGHNPLAAGPNDWLDKNKNLTQRTVELAVGGVLSGDLQPGSASYESSLKALTDAMAGQFQKNITIVLDPLTYTPTDTPESREAYLDTMSDAMIRDILPAGKDTEAFLESISDVSLANPVQLLDDAARYRTFSASTRRLAGIMGDRAGRVAAIAVPRSFASQHHMAVRLLRTLQKYYQLAGELKNDPLQGSLILQSLITLHYEVFPKFLYDFNEAIYIKSGSGSL